MARNDTQHFLAEVVNYRDIFAAFDEGVILTDRDGRIMFYNDTQARIDGVAAAPIGQAMTRFYQLTDDTSLVMRCLATQEAIRNRHLIYKTRLGRTVNSICSVFPLFSSEGLVGAACFVREYNLVEETITSICSRRTGKPPDRPAGSQFSFADIIGHSDAMQTAVKTAKMAALTPSPVMMVGATGTGKELFAQAMHGYGPRKDQPCVAINCAAIPENLLEGILFGTVKGAFTGAVDKQGLFEKADGGTLFLDEINSMPLGLQAKLLRVIQEKCFRRVGSLDERSVDVKILSSLNEDPHAAIDGGRLRLDLFYRLGVVLLRLPALQERKEDLAELVDTFVAKFNRALGRQVEGIGLDVAQLFAAHDWPGNVRELEHVIEGAMNVVGERRRIELSDLPPHLRAGTPTTAPPPITQPVFPPPAPSTAAPPAPAPPSPPAAPAGESLPPPDLRSQQLEQERLRIVAALTTTAGNVSRAAEQLGLSRQLLHYKLKRHGLRREDFSSP